MALGLEDKKAIVADVNATASDALSLVVADARGVGVSDMTELRVKAREANVDLRVVRNTLAKRAFEGTEETRGFVPLRHEGYRCGREEVESRVAELSDLRSNDRTVMVRLRGVSFAISRTSIGIHIG